MTLTHILAAAGCAALLSGTAAMAGDERPKDVVGNLPAESITPVNPTADMPAPMASDATTAGMPASTLAPDNAPGTVTTRLITNGPVPDTPENRAKYGQPMSRAGKATAASGN